MRLLLTRALCPLLLLASLTACSSSPVQQAPVVVTKIEIHKILPPTEFMECPDAPKRLGPVTTVEQANPLLAGTVRALRLCQANNKKLKEWVASQ